MGVKIFTVNMLRTQTHTDSAQVSGPVISLVGVLYFMFWGRRASGD